MKCHACTIADTLSDHGYALIERVIDDAAIADLCAAAQAACTNRDPQGKRPVHSLRNLFEQAPGTLSVLRGGAIGDIVASVLGRGAFAVRGVLFDKLPGANWLVAWHQDQAIAVREKVETPGFGPWSLKQGVVHVEPPLSVLENMLTLRIHLDDCGSDNGPLQVIPGSHRRGRLHSEDIQPLRQQVQAVTCTARRGDVLAMKPLLVHASSQSQKPEHRRIIHVEFAAQPLPGRLQWYEQHRIG